MPQKEIILSALMVLAIQVNAQFTTPAEHLEKHVYTLAADSLLGRGFGTPQGLQAAHYIAAQYKEAGVQPLNGTYFHPFNHRTGILNISGTNVAGLIPGNDPQLKEEYILLGAHFDHVGWNISKGDTVIFNGADDNASGTASIIEIGRNLAAQQESLGRSVIIVAFDGEESGLIGSRRFLQDSVVSPEKIKLMFSLDMVGMYGAHGGLDLPGSKLLKDPEKITRDLAEEYNITVTKSNTKIDQRTDTAPFGEIGIPAIHAYTGQESPYHKPEDDATALDYEGMALVASYLSAATLQLSTEDHISRLQARQDGQPELSGPKVFQPGLRVRMGSSHHNYKAQFYEGKPVMSAEAGLFASIRTTSFLYLQPEVLYETKGSKHADGKLRTHSITTPLNLLITSPENELVKTYFLIGGYFSYHFGGKVDGTALDFQQEYEQQEFGMSYGFGLQVMNVQLGLCIRKGFSSLLQDSGAGSVMHEGVSFSLGYLF